MKKVLLMLLVLAMLVSVFAGCAKDTEEPDVDQEPTDEVTPGDTTDDPEEPTPEEPTGPIVFNWNIGADPKTIDPGLNGASDGGDVINNTFEGLVREKSGVVQPGIAESWDISEDGKTVTFHLRKSNWSDGTPLTANDFVYAWLRAMAPETASEYSWIWHYTHVVGAEEYVSTMDISGHQDTIDKGVGALKDEEDPESTITEEQVTAAQAAIEELSKYTPETVGIKAVDEYTFEVKLTKRTDYFVSLMAFYHFMPVKQSAVEAPGGEEGTWASNPELTVCNGPFLLKEYTIGDGLVLERNPEYWNAEEVGLDVINGAFIDETNTAYISYQSGDLDFLNLVPTTEIPKLMAEDPNFYLFPLLGTYYYNFNMDKEIWANVDVRRAFALAIDREKICNVAAAGYVPAAGFVPPGFLDADGKDFFEVAGTYGLATDGSKIEEAQALMEKAGYPNGEGFPEFTLLYNTTELHEAVATMIQQMLQDNLGITCKIQNQEWAVFQDTRTQGNYEMARGGWLTDFMDPIGLLGIFVPGNSYNDPNYDNPEYTAAIEAASAATTPEEHFKALYEAQTILMTDMPILPVMHYADHALARETLIGWDRSVLGTIDFSSATMEQ